MVGTLEMLKYSEIEQGAKNQQRRLRENNH